MNVKQDAKLELTSGIETLQGANSLKVGHLIRIHHVLLPSQLFTVPYEIIKTFKIAVGKNEIHFDRVAEETSPQERSAW